VAGRETFVEEWNGHNAFARPHKFDELLQQSHFFRFYDELKFHICPEMGKCSGSKSQFCQKVDIAPFCCQPSTYVEMVTTVS